MTAFQQWVANTVVNLGGSLALYQQGLERKQALTSFVSGMDACQDPGDCQMKKFIPMSMRLTSEAPTNLDRIH